MDKTRRRERARDDLSRYVSGPDATARATARALARVGDSRAVVLVEGISDQIALETLAVRRHGAPGLFRLRRRPGERADSRSGSLERRGAL